MSDPLSSRREWLARNFGVVVTADNHAAVRGADMVVLCVEPQALDDVHGAELAPIASTDDLGGRGYPLSRIQARLAWANQTGPCNAQYAVGHRRWCHGDGSGGWIVLV